MQDSADIPTSTPLDGWLSELGEAQGAPGGGAAAGVMLGIGAALLRMVAEYTDEARAAECSGRLVDARADALVAVESDGVASAEFGAALALSTDDPQRDARVRDAAIAAAESSARVGAVGLALIPEVRLLDEIGNRSLLADLAVAAEALRAGISGALINLHSNRRLARRHGADAAALDALDDAGTRLVDARDEIARIADDLASRLAE